MEIKWKRCGDDSHWCDFNKLKLDSENFKNLKGVYIIWSGEDVIRIGSGVIKDRIAAHREDKEITAYENLKVTWAEVNANQMENVEAYLANVLEPLVGERFPDRNPIEVNLPW